MCAILAKIDLSPTIAGAVMEPLNVLASDNEVVSSYGDLVEGTPDRVHKLQVIVYNQTIDLSTRPTASPQR